MMPTDGSAARQLRTGENDDLAVRFGLRLDLERFAGGLNSSAPLVQLHRAKGHPVPRAEMAGLHLDHDLAQFNAAGRPSTKVQDRRVLVDWFGPTGELSAETDELFFRVGKVAAFHQVDRQINGGSRVRPFLVEPAFPKSRRGKRGGVGIRRSYAIGQFMFGPCKDQLQESILFFTAIAGFEGANQFRDAGRSALFWRRNELFVQANHANKSVR